MSEEWDVIYSYSRKQAIENGEPYIRITEKNVDEVI